MLLLSNAYERSMQQMKSESSVVVQPEGDLEAVLSEFAEVVAHKALIDGHIAILQGESLVPINASSSDSSVSQNIGVVQETENILIPLCGSDFFPMALNCSEVASILHRNLLEPRSSRNDDFNSESAAPAVAVNEDLIREKYQGEIEQLRALTEKGMSAIESSHKRVIAELEEKHMQDLARLQVCRH